MSILLGVVVVAGAVVLLATPAAFARTDTKFGPDLRVVGQGEGSTATTTSVALNLTLSPSYSSQQARRRRDDDERATTPR